jgi:hypothetical protein
MLFKLTRMSDSTVKSDYYYDMSNRYNNSTIDLLRICNSPYFKIELRFSPSNASSDQVYFIDATDTYGALFIKTYSVQPGDVAALPYEDDFALVEDYQYLDIYYNTIIHESLGKYTRENVDYW